jgi:hypothetical protein
MDLAARREQRLLDPRRRRLREARAASPARGPRSAAPRSGSSCTRCTCPAGVAATPSPAGRPPTASPSTPETPATPASRRRTGGLVPDRRAGARTTRGGVARAKLALPRGDLLEQHAVTARIEPRRRRPGRPGLPERRRLRDGHDEGRRRREQPRPAWARRAVTAQGAPPSPAACESRRQPPRCRRLR